ncbi:hypothetical protein GLO73106DRAFT_00033080 [Gloeocapsa sp. PCC 73106]|nr:hypothetical protein GLO73106DRAFT_00033080 [Gloeocapsa sp. PCC 73106]
MSKSQNKLAEFQGKREAVIEILLNEYIKY